MCEVKSEAVDTHIGWEHSILISDPKTERSPPHTPPPPDIEPTDSGHSDTDTPQGAPLDVWIKTEVGETEVTSPHYYSDATKIVETELRPALPLVASRPHGCAECGRGFRTRLALALHHRRCRDPHAFSCQLCERLFSNVSNLARHQQQRCLERAAGSLTCPHCHKVFHRAYLLKSHLRKHDDDRPYECDICSMRFKHKSTVDRHKLLHTNTKPYPCHYCGKRFTTATLMKPHLRTHTKEKPFQCPICLKKFSQKHNMQRHALQHNKIKHLVCEVCKKQFPKESRLKYHMRVHWADNKPFKCTQCPKTYSHKQNILRHYRKKHPTVEYIAPDTDAGLATKAWQAQLGRKLRQEHADTILPEVTTEADDELVKPELVILDGTYSSDSNSGESE